MAKDSIFNGVTQSLSVENRSIENIVFLPTKPVLDSELNLISDSLAAKMQDVLRSKAPSGWLDAEYSKGYDPAGETFGLNFGDTPNKFVVFSNKETPTKALINGWLLQIGGSNISDATKLEIELPTAPSTGSRSDLVFLEVWKAQIGANPSVSGKPSATEIYKYGNTQHGGVNPLEQIVNPAIGFETTQRVQVQYRLRVVPGVNFTNYPEGVNDTAAVLAQGGNSLVTTYTFANGGDTWEDYGLYIAGDGTNTAKMDLKTVDGYVYAVPMFRIHRRNKEPFTLINQNGATYSILSGFPSDRPDGLYYDQIHAWDIEDLRHTVSIGDFNYKKLLEENTDNLFAGKLDTLLQRSSLDVNLSRTNVGLQVDGISPINQSGVSQIVQSDSQLRYFSDISDSRKIFQLFGISDKFAGINGTNWVSSDKIQVTVVSNIAGSVVSTFTPKVIYNYNNTVVPVVGTWSGLGTTSAEFTLGINPTLTSQNLSVVFEIAYAQKGFKMTKPVTEVLKVTEPFTGKDWGFVSINSPTSRREKEITLRTINGYTDVAHDYLTGTTDGYITLIEYHMNGNGGQSYVIPGDIITTQDLLYVYSAYDITTASYMEISVIRNALTYALTVTVPRAFVSGETIKFKLALKSNVLEFDERSQSITNMYATQFYEKTVAATSTVVFESCDLPIGDPKNIAIQSMGMYLSPNSHPEGTGIGFYHYCYLNNILTKCTATVEADSNYIKLTFPSTVTGTINLPIQTSKTLLASETLNVFYNYYEYQGVTYKANFGTNANSFIRSKIVYHDNKLGIYTNGTGAINTADELPKAYEPLLPKLPALDSIHLGNFTGTIHAQKLVQGGGYNLLKGSPYIVDKENTLTKNGVIQKKGTFKGGNFANKVVDGEGSVHKFVVGNLIEKVIEDGSKNFLPGELALKIETNYLNGTTTNRITNYDSGDLTNSYDMFKLVGRPLVKNK